MRRVVGPKVFIYVFRGRQKSSWLQSKQKAFGGGSPEPLRARQSPSRSCAGWALHASSTCTRRVGTKCRERTKVQCGPTARFVSRRSPRKKKRVLKTHVQLLFFFRGNVALFRCVVQQVTAVLLPPIEDGCMQPGAVLQREWLRGWLFTGHPEKSQKGSLTR